MEHDEACLAFWGRYCGGFTKDYGLAAVFFRELELGTDEAVVFLHKLDLIYAANMEIWQRKMRRENA